MKFVEESGGNWSASQLKAAELEIEQQKREWEEKRLVQLEQEALERQKAEKENNELLTYSREDALNKVNIKSDKKSILGKRKSESANQSQSQRASQRNKNSSNGTVTRNGIIKENDSHDNSNSSSVSAKEKVPKAPQKDADLSSSSAAAIKRATRQNTSLPEENSSQIRSNSKHPAMLPRRAMSRKSDRSSSSKSKKTPVRSISESTRSTSISRQTSVLDDSDSECSLDVMIDSNDVNDSDSNSNHNAKVESNFDSTSQDDDTMINDDSTITDETTIERTPRNHDDKSKSTSSPRTRSRGTVKINLWTLDDSPILPPKRSRTGSVIRSSESVKDEKQIKQEEKQLKSDFNVKECKVSITDIQKKPAKTTTAPSPQSRTQKRLLSSAKNNHTLDSWVQKMPEPIAKNNIKPTSTSSVNSEREENEDGSVTTTRATRRSIAAAVTNKTL
jgi:hypothetical protein